MDQANFLESLRTFYPTKFEEGEPTEFTRIEHLTEEQVAEIISAKDLLREDLAQEIAALNVYRTIKFKGKGKNHE